MTQYVSTLVSVPVFTDDNDPLVVVTASGSITTTDAVGITSTGTTFGHATVDGSVYAADVGIIFSSAESVVQVSASGIVHGFVAGVTLGDSGSTLTNAGQIRASDVGAINSGLQLGGFDNYVVNSGLISGVYGIRAETEGYRNQIVNSGTISGSLTAIDLNMSNGLTGFGALAVDPSRYGVFNHGQILGGSNGIVGSGPIRVVNTGLINAANMGVSIASFGGDASTLTNSGIIVANMVFRGGMGADSVINTGRLEGELQFRAGSDLYDGQGGTVLGAVHLGDDADTAHGGSGLDLLFGDDGSDALFGHGGDDSIEGGLDNDTLDGGEGADVLIGGDGDDIYVIDNGSDVVDEQEINGIDTVLASMSYTLAANVENLVLSGAQHLSGTGNDLANTLTGNDGDNLLDGGAGIDALVGGKGHDTYIVDDTADTVTEDADAGTDTVRASVSYALARNGEHLILTGADAIDGTGNELANTIVGNDGNNLLDGGAGADDLLGGKGNDTYVVDDEADVVTEAADQGTDAVRASVSYALTAHVENLVLTGSADLSGTGNALANAIMGNAGSNTLLGGQGDDTLDGGAGRDTAHFSGSRQNYTIMANGDGSFTVTDTVGQDGEDVVRNIEALEFSDGTVSLTNRAPTAPVVQGSVSAVDENAAPHKVVATVRSTDQEGDALTYSFASNPGSKFAIDSTTGVITLVGSVDYEQNLDVETETQGPAAGQKFYRLVVKAAETVSGISSGETTVKVYVNDVNEAPTGLSFADGTRAATISEANAVDGYEIGLLQAFDPEQDDELVFAFDTSGRGGSSGSGNAGGRFKIEDGKLKVAALTDITKPETYTVTIKVTDKNGDEGSTSTYRDFLIRVNPAAETPVPVLSIAPTASSVQTEGNDGFKEFVFTVTRTNPSGDTQATWQITGTGITGEDFEFLTGTVSFTGTEAAQEIKVKVRGDTSFESNEIFRIPLTDPSNGQISGPNGSATGRIDNDDPAPPDAPVISIVADQVSKAEGHDGFTDFTFKVTRMDPDGDNTVRWTLGLDTSSADDFSGDLSGMVEFTGVETEKTITLRVKGDTSFEGNEAFTVTLSNLTGNGTFGTATASSTILNDDAQPVPPANQPPSITPPNFSVQELAGAGTAVGAITAADPEGSALTYELVNSAEGRFKLAGNQLLVDNGFKLDHEQAAAHQVTVRVKDAAGNATDQTFSVGVNDWKGEVTAGSVAHDVFKGGAEVDRLSGGLGDDRLFGGAGNDTLRGEAGNDVLGGGEGKDKLYGLKGKTSKDAFLFDTKLTSKSVANKHKDTIYDFGAKYDAIYFDDAAFSNKTIAKALKNKGASLDKPLKMKAGFFKVGDKAADKDDFFILKGKKLYWDVDGSGAKAMVEIATLKLQKGEGTTLTHKDFFFV